MPTLTASALRSAAILFPLVGLFAAPGCGGDRPISLRVVSGTGCDPFVAPISADQARITLQGLNVPPQTVPVAADGTFRARIVPSDLTTPGRILIEALRNDVVVGTGATPYLPWGQLINQQISVLMHCSRGLVRSSVGLASGHADFRLWPYGTTGPLIATANPGSTGNFYPEGFDLFALTQAPLPLDNLPSLFDGDTSVLFVAYPMTTGGTSYRNLLLHGMDNDWWPPDTMGSTLRYGDTSLPVERTELVGAGTLITSPIGNGGWLVGGRSGMQRSARVDHVLTNATFVSPAPPRLTVARSRPELLELQGFVDRTSTTDMIPEIMLVTGGQTASDPALELYSSAAGMPPPAFATMLQPENASFGTRTEVTTVCLRVTGSMSLCPRILMLGGLVAGGTALTTDDALLDGDCLARRLMNSAEHCNPVFRTGQFLSSRRHHARATVSEGGDVVVAGGFMSFDDSMPARMLDIIDASNPDMPVAVGPEGPLSASEPAILAVPNGSVMIAGGLRFTDNQPDDSVWFYRR